MFSDLISSLCVVLPTSLVVTVADPPPFPAVVTLKLAATWLLKTVIPMVFLITFCVLWVLIQLSTAGFSLTSPVYDTTWNGLMLFDLVAKFCSI